MQFFQNFIDFFTSILQNFGKFKKYALVGVRGAEPLEASKFIKNLVKKSM